MKFKQELRESALTEKTSTASRLDTYKDAHPEACQETVDKSKRNFEEVQSLLNHWLHIQEVFEEQKENIHDNPMQDINSLILLTSKTTKKQRRENHEFTQVRSPIEF